MAEEGPGAHAATIDDARGEPLAPVLLTLVVFAVIPFVMPDRLTTVPAWVLAGVEVALIIAMVALDPGRIDRQSQSVRNVRIALISVLVLEASGAVAVLSFALLEGHEDVARGGPLLVSGALVWAGLAISFGFLYWEMDSGGPGARAHDIAEYPDFAFPQHLSPEVCPPGWRPYFLDYLYLGVTNGLAFSPTDTMPLTPWTKLAMGSQSLASLLVLGLVIARAVNVLD